MKYIKHACYWLYFLLAGPKKTDGRGGTLIILPITSSKTFTRDATKWDICCSRQERTVLTLQVQIPHTAGVGLWRMKIISKVVGHNQSKIHDCKENIYVLFNPWCKGKIFIVTQFLNILFEFCFECLLLSINGTNKATVTLYSEICIS